jgi:hypothetical protein
MSPFFITPACGVRVRKTAAVRSVVALFTAAAAIMRPKDAACLGDDVDQLFAYYRFPHAVAYAGLSPHHYQSEIWDDE